MDPCALYFLVGFISFPIMFVAAALSSSQFRQWANEQQDAAAVAHKAGYKQGFSKGRYLEIRRKQLFKRVPRRKYRAQMPMVLVAPHTGD